MNDFVVTIRSDQEALADTVLRLVMNSDSVCQSRGLNTVTEYKSVTGKTNDRPRSRWLKIQASVDFPSFLLNRHFPLHASTLLQDTLTTIGNWLTMFRFKIERKGY